MSNNGSGILKGCLLSVVLIFVVLLLIGFSIKSFMSDVIDAEPNIKVSGDKIGLLEINEAIFSSSVYVKGLKVLRNEETIKSIVVRINSPGGTIGSSQEIFEEVKKTVKSGKPVIISMGDVAASGGYYIAIGGTKIFANPGTITGSIGVILSFPMTKDLMDKVGLGLEIVKSGKYKDAGSGHRKMTREERGVFQSMIDDLYQQFLTAVSLQRNLSVDSLKKLECRIVSGKSALEYGLIDSLGTYEDAKEYAKSLVGLDGNCIEYKYQSRKKIMEELLEGLGASVGNSIKEQFKPEALYIYR